MTPHEIQRRMGVRESNPEQRDDVRKIAKRAKARYQDRRLAAEMAGDHEAVLEMDRIRRVMLGGSEKRRVRLEGRNLILSAIGRPLLDGDR